MIHVLDVLEDTTKNETGWYRVGSSVIPPFGYPARNRKTSGVALTLLNAFDPLVLNVPGRITKEGS